jgi:hypothetical protein
MSTLVPGVSTNNFSTVYDKMPSAITCPDQQRQDSTIGICPPADSAGFTDQGRAFLVQVTETQ